jgi:hypothetical protein
VGYLGPNQPKFLARCCPGAHLWGARL